MSECHYTIKDPDKAYLTNNLLLPKTRINVSVIKAALTFTLNDEVPIVDETTHEVIGTRAKLLRLWDETTTHMIVPRNFLPPEQYPEFGCEFVAIPPPMFEQVRIDDHITLRDDEQRAAYRALLSNYNGTLHVSCGKGKTILALKAAATIKVPTIIVVNTTALLEQWKEEIGRHLGVRSVGVLQGQTQDWEGHPIVLAMVHTLSNRRWPMALRQRFGLAIYDECFPAGTLVGKVPIQKIQPGDTVPSCSPDGQVLAKRVVRVIRNRVSTLVRIRAGQRSIVCTPNHPFLTKAGWTKAEDLTGGSVVLGITGTPEPKGAIVDHSQSCGGPLQGMWSPDLEIRKGRSGAGEKERSVLLKEMRQDAVRSGKLQADGENQSKVRLSQDEEEQPHEKSRSTGKSQRLPESNGVGAPSTRRERETSPDCPATPSAGTEVAHGSGGGYAAREAEPHCQSLQTGHREPALKIGDRSGRSLSPVVGCEESRPEEGEVLSWIRVDCVEVLEPGSDGTFGGVCPDGLVYNLEVEDPHTYLANGFVVHNCHHMSAPVFVLSADLFFGRRFSLTATASRTDGLEVIYQYHLGKVIHCNLTQELVPTTVFHFLKWAIPPEHRKLVVDRNDDVNIPRVRTYLGRLEWRNNLIYAHLAQDLQEGRQILVLSHSVSQVEMLHNYLSGAGAGMITGLTLQENRMPILRNSNPVFGTFQLAREGLNKPTLDTLYVVTPFNNANDVQQAWGRIQRRSEGKKDPLVRVFEDGAFTCCVRSCSGLRSVLRKFNYPYERVTWERT